MSNAPLLVIDNLSKYFNTAAGQLHAVDGVSFTLEEGKTLVWKFPEFETT